MNTANLQLEGFYMVIAALNDAFVAKGMISREAIDSALGLAEMAAIDDSALSGMSPANRDAVAFPARLLRLANDCAQSTGIRPFSELAKLVGQTKEPYAINRDPVR